MQTTSTRDSLKLRLCFITAFDQELVKDLNPPRKQTRTEELSEDQYLQNESQNMFWRNELPAKKIISGLQ